MGMKKKIFARLIAIYQVPGNVLICLRNKAISGIRAAFGVTTS